MRYTLLIATVTVLAVTVLAAHGASAQAVQAHFALGFETDTKSFDKNGTRTELNGAGSTLRHFTVPINVGAFYNFYHGLGLGIDLAVAMEELATAGGSDIRTFGMREAIFRIGYGAGFGIHTVGITAGFKLDAGARAQDIRAGDIATSDQQHAIMARINYGVNLWRGLSVHVGTGFVFHIERTVIDSDPNNGGNPRKIQSGIVVDPYIGVSHAWGPVSIGLNLGLFYQATGKVNGVSVPDSDAYTFHVAPFVAYELPIGGRIKLSFDTYNEDGIVGIPIVGRNMAAPVIPPFTISWSGAFL